MRVLEKIAPPFVRDARRPGIVRRNSVVRHSYPIPAGRTTLFEEGDRRRHKTPPHDLIILAKLDVSV